MSNKRRMNLTALPVLGGLSAIAALSMGALVSSAAMASTLTVDRGLPTANLNNAAGSNRSNVAWAEGTDAGGADWVADTFSLSSARVINDLRVWVVTDPDPAGGYFGNYYNDMSLYLGPAAGSTINKASSTTFTANSNASSNPNVSVTAVTYAGGASYQGYLGGFHQIWQVDFTNLGILSAGSYMFALTGPTAPPGSNYTFMHASNAALGGVPADGADGIMYAYTGLDGAASLTADTDGDSPWTSNAPGIWDKSSDLNVQVFTSATPLPAALPLFASGLGIMGLLGWRKKRKHAAPAAA